MCAAEWRSTRQTAADSFRNAGGNVVDQEVVTDQNITSSRWPDDLPAFCARIVEQFAAPGKRPPTLNRGMNHGPFGEKI